MMDKFVLRGQEPGPSRFPPKADVTRTLGWSGRFPESCWGLQTLKLPEDLTLSQGWGWLEVSGLTKWLDTSSEGDAKLMTCARSF